MLVSVIGPSCAGKSTLAKTLAVRRPGLVARVPVDAFFVPRSSGESLAEFLTRPLCYDWETIDHVLASDAQSQRTSPTVDFTTFDRLAAEGGLPIPVVPVYVLDGMRPHPRTDALVVLTLDDTEQRRRLRERDNRWGTTVVDNLAHLRSTYQRGQAEVEDQGCAADLVLDATAPVLENATRVEKLIADHLTVRRCEA